MTVRTIAMQTCDRCLKPFGEKMLKAGDEVPVMTQKGLVITQITGTNKDVEPKSKILLKLVDLCPDCDQVVFNLITKIDLNGGVVKKKKTPAKKRPPEKEQEQSSTTTEYTEDEKVASAPDPEEPESEPPEKVEETNNPEPVEKDEETKKSEPPEKVEETKKPEPEKSRPAPAKKRRAKSENSKESESDSKPDTATVDKVEAAKASSDSGLDDSKYLVDPETGDIYDRMTGEVVEKSESSGTDGHPF